VTTEDGGSPVLGYDLWRDDGRNGDFQSLYYSKTILATSSIDLNVSKGFTYRYNYRARNINGYEDFSHVGYLFAADVPSIPDAPTLISVDANEIKL
jgi:hypothetical protein